MPSVLIDKVPQIVSLSHCVNSSTFEKIPKICRSYITITYIIYHKNVTFVAIATYVSLHYTEKYNNYGTPYSHWHDKTIKL